MLPDPGDLSLTLSVVLFVAAGLVIVATGIRWPASPTFWLTARAWARR